MKKKKQNNLHNNKLTWGSYAAHMRLICIQLAFPPSPTPLLRQKNSLFSCNLMSLDKREGERGNVWLPWPPAASQIPQRSRARGLIHSHPLTWHEWFQAECVEYMLSQWQGHITDVLLDEQKMMFKTIISRHDSDSWLGLWGRRMRRLAGVRQAVER